MYFYTVMILCILFGCFCSLTFDMANVLTFLFAICFIFVIKLVVFNKKNVLNLLTLLLIISFCIGAFMGTMHYRRIFREAETLYGTEVCFEGTVISSGKNFLEIEVGNRKYTVYSFAENMPEVNACVSVKGVLQAHSVSPYPGGFDSRLYNALKGNVGHITCDNIDITGSVSRHNLSTSVKNYINKRILSLKASDEAKGFIIAVLTGNKDYLDDDTVSDFSMCGISHIIAISGLHVGIFLSLFLGLSAFFDKKRIAKLVFAVLLVLSYAILIGGGASVVRASIMAIMGAGFLCLRRRSDSLINLSTAGLIICIANPFYVVNSGFIMSFVATFVIVIYADYFKRKWLAIPFVVWVFMLPFSIYYYNVFSAEAVVVNIIVIPLIPFLILFGYAGCLVPFVLRLAGGIAQFTLYVADYFSSIDIFHIYLPSTKLWQFVVWGILLVAFYMTLCKKKKIFIYGLLLVAVGVFINAIYVGTGNDDSKICVNFINCGNFNMHHIKTDGGKNILVDCSDDVCDYAVKCGIDEFYGVILTKNTASRRAGLEELCNNYDVKYAILPDGMDTKNLNLEKTRILYYNYNSCSLKTDSVEFNFTYRNESRCLLVKLFDDVIAVPVDKTVTDTGAYTVISLPDECVGVKESVEKNYGEYYIHPTYKNSRYEFGNKYITSVDGMVQMIFEKGREPLVN